MSAVQFDETHLTTRDGLRLFLRRAVVAQPRANILLMHGLGEHSARYFHVAEFLARRGYRLCAFDLRGHGRSGGVRGQLERYDHLLEDSEQAWSYFHEDGLPAFLYGHSLGGQIALHFARRNQSAMQGAVIASPWLRLSLKPKPWKLLLARAALTLHPDFTQDTGMRIERLSRDLDFLSSMQDLDLVHHRMSARMFFALKEAAEAMFHGRQESWKIPLLILHGTADPVTSAEASEEFFRRLPVMDKTLKLYPGTLHETHNDVNRSEVLQDIADWLDARCPREPNASSQPFSSPNSAGHSDPSRLSQ